MEYESKLSDIIASLPEVSGGFLYSPDRGIYSNQAGTIASDTALQKVSLKLTKIISMLSIHFNDTGGIRVTFNNLILFGMRIEEGNWLFLLHQPSLTPGMIKMTVQMALNIQQEEIPPQPEPEIADDSSVDVSEDEPNAGDIMAGIMAPGSELSKPLTIIQEELAVHIGPVAELIFEDSVKKWCASGSPSLENLPELIAVFAEEIDDEDDCKLFKENLKSYLVS
jgi:hypothetical protein